MPNIKYRSINESIYLVTGGNGLIGSDLCQRLLNLGANVISCDIKNNIKKRDNFQFLDIDLTSEIGIKELKIFLSENKNINGFIHSAYPKPPSWGKKFENLTLKDVNLHLNTQLGSSIILSRLFCEYLKDQGGGHLVNLGSIQGVSAPKFTHYEGTSMNSPIEYSCIKSSIIIMTKWLSKYYKNHNININCVSPGGILDSQPEIFKTKYKKDCNNIGMLSPDDISGIIIFLLSDFAKGINGQNLIVDDGWTL